MTIGLNDVALQKIYHALHTYGTNYKTDQD